MKTQRSEVSVQANVRASGRYAEAKTQRSEVSVQANVCPSGRYAGAKHLLSFIAAAFLASSAWAHGGEDHGDGAAPAMAGNIAPRAVAQSEEFELVAVLANDKLMFYLDRYADNAPVPDAELEVESGAFKAIATQIAPGVYSVPGQSFAQPGKHPLTISVQAGDASDLLTATLDHAPPAVAVEHVHGWGEWIVWGAAGSLLLAAGGLVAVRRRKRKN
ncbi:MAG: LPXTG cell wall anchor domain-containing protein [Betaproteobacteria bacterium]|nr:LPXTG cell wall anchor domain-containing protein [Betaproteobacteria bacterium]